MQPFYACLLLLLLFSPSIVSAQAPTDVVHLVSGQAHEGIIIEQKPGISIRLWRVSQGDTLSFTMEEIDRITRILPSVKSPASVNPEISGGRRNYVMLQGCIGGGDFAFGGFGLELGRRLGAQNQTWLGLSANYLGNTLGGDALQIFPIMADLRQVFATSTNGRSSTLVFLDAGYVVSIGSEARLTEEVKYGNGFALNPGIAFKFNIVGTTGLMLDIGWLHHSGKLHWVSPEDRPDSVKTWNTILLRGNLFF